RRAAIDVRRTVTRYWWNDFDARVSEPDRAPARVLVVDQRGDRDRRANGGRGSTAVRFIERRDEELKRIDPERAQMRDEAVIRRSGVDERGLRALSNENRIALSDVDESNLEWRRLVGEVVRPPSLSRQTCGIVAVMLVRQRT